MASTNYTFVPFEFPRTTDGKYISLLDDAGILRSRREQLGLTMQQVAEMAGLKFSQYQRIEAGERALEACSMKVGLSICAALLLDPYKMVRVDVKQENNLKPQVVIDKIIDLPKRVGRKQIRRDIMTVYLNYMDYSIMIPYDVLSNIGINNSPPSHVQFMWDMKNRRIIIRPADENTEEALDVPEKKFEDSLLSLPTILSENPISAMHWETTPHEVEAKLVKDQGGKIALLLNLKMGRPIQHVNGCFVVPKCLTDEDEWDSVVDNEE